MAALRPEVEPRQSTEEGNIEYGDAIDPATFEQILEMDEDDESREFSTSIVDGFFEQAEKTFSEMDEALQKKDLNQLSQLGHFLKGSSATLGLVKVRDHCEKIQNIGHQKDDKGEDAGWDEKTCLDKIEEIVKVLKTDYADAERRLKAFYHDVPRDT